MSIAVFNGAAFVAGKTESTDFPVLNAVQGQSAGNTDGFLLKITGLSAPVASLSSIGVSPSNVPAGTSSTGTITLSAAAPADGATVTLTSSNTNATTVPASVAVPAGATSVSFQVTSKPVTAPTPVTISGSYGGVAKTAVLTVSPAAGTLSGITVSPNTVVGPAPATGTITLSAAAPAGGVTVTSTSSNTNAATVPATVNVAAGASAATFTIATKTVAAATPVTIGASYSGVTKSVVLTGSAPLNSVNLAPAQVIGSMSSTATVKLNSAAPAGGALIALTSSNTAACYCAIKRNDCCALSTTFTVTTKAVTAPAVAAISAAYNGAAKSANLTVQPALASMSVSPNPVAGPKTATGTVTLTLAAPTTGIVVSLSSGNTAANGSGERNGTRRRNLGDIYFDNQAGGRTSNCDNHCRLQGSYEASGAHRKAGKLILAVSPTAIVESKNVSGTVTLGTAAPAGGGIITLTSSKPAVAPHRRASQYLPSATSPRSLSQRKASPRQRQLFFPRPTTDIRAHGRSP